MKSVLSASVYGLSVSILGLVACQTWPEDEDAASLTQPEAWNAANNPRTAISSTYKINVLSLKSAATLREPIPGDYWAARRDSINVLWDTTTFSASDKYGSVFLAPLLQQVISAEYGTSSPDATTSWAGICDGWASYAFSERPPLLPVTRKTLTGQTVTFWPGDITGLMSLVYTDATQKAISTRCDVASPTIGTDGRYSATECRDMNPGSFHVVLANRLGEQGKHIVIERSTSAPVWNHPLFHYKFDQVLEVTKSAAATLVKGTSATTYPWNTSAARFFHVKTTVKWMNEATPSRLPRSPASYTISQSYQYILETNSAGDILGGEWVGTSKTTHPDFMWYPSTAPVSAAGGLITYKEARKLNDASNGVRVDVNQDSNVDILWHNGATGELSTWHMSGTTATSTVALSWVSKDSTGWRAVGTGDFNYDGTTDLLWYNPNGGAVGLWEMKATEVVRGDRWLSWSADQSTGWAPVATGDFNRDGKIDVLWYHAASGQLGAWLLDETTVTASLPFAQALTGWTVVSTGDFDADGYTDVLWYKASTGTLKIWYVQNGTKLREADVNKVSPASSGWVPVAVGDYDKSGSPDVLWTNPSGQVRVWTLKNSTYVATKTVNWTYDTAWRVVGH